MDMSENKISRQMSRRKFLEQLGQGLAFASLPAALSSLGLLSSQAHAKMGIPYEVEFYEQLPGKQTQCFVCPLDCILNDGETCFCRTRNNRGGVLYTFAFNNPCILQYPDPIEKMPLNHFLPGTNGLSIATGGCNLRCLYCQNWEQAQSKPEKLKTTYFSHYKAEYAARLKNIKLFCYTYTEPVVFSEYIIDIAKHTRPRGVRQTVASALFMRTQPLKQLCKYVDAFSITLKGFSEVFYKNVCGQSLKPVLKAIEVVKESGTWFELVNLIVPTYNDSRREIKAMCRWIVKNLGPDVPIHFARFVPKYKLRNLPQTPVRTLEAARQIALAAGIKYAYIANVAPHKGNNTYCSSCSALVIERLGFKILKNHLRRGRCPKCRRKIPGVWK